MLPRPYWQVKEWLISGLYEILVKQSTLSPYCCRIVVCIVPHPSTSPSLVA